MLKYENIFKIKYTEAILSNNTWKLLWFEITEMLIAVLKIEFIVLFIIIFGTVSFAVDIDTTCRYRLHFPADITASSGFAKLRFHFFTRIRFCLQIRQNIQNIHNTFCISSEI